MSKPESKTAEHAWEDYQSAARSYFDLRDRPEMARLDWLDTMRRFDEAQNAVLVDQANGV